jgi:outer membrane receptor protein involved in Fe transport
MKEDKWLILFSLLMATGTSFASPTEVLEDSVALEHRLQGVEVRVKRKSSLKLRSTAQNSELLNSSELKRAACCNLGESFTNNPSVEVSYSDAATGSRQIKLLGLSGTYVQMLTENIPNLRGAAAPYGLNYIAGPWMHTIQISKGASSVKNGYESVTGQIDVEYLKPQDDQKLDLNAYADHRGRVEANATGNIHLNDKWSTGLLLHGENTFTSHDENGDGFMDSPKIKQFSGMNRWAYLSDNYIFQAGVKFVGEDRTSGQDSKHISGHSASMPLYTVDIDTRRWEGFAKNAFIINKENNTNIALMLSGSLHDQDATYGYKRYDVMQKNFYASLMFESTYGYHALSTGLSYNYDFYDQHYRLENLPEQPLEASIEKESVPGAYAQYTFDYNRRLIVMAGLRYDYSSLYHSMLTPRVHIKWNAPGDLTFYASAGKGYRAAHRLADFNYLLASSRKLILSDAMQQESAWNTGGGILSNLRLFRRDLTLTAEYYYTRFHRQAVVDLDTDSHAAILLNNVGKSYSHTVQVEASYVPFRDFTFTAAYRYTDVRENYGYGLVRKPLSAKSKGLFTINYTPMMAKWQFDVSLALNGGGRMPTSYTLGDGSASWDATYAAYPLLNAQVTRSFRHFDFYVGGENLTGYKQKNPIIGADNPWGSNFDATMVYGPIHGALGYVGVRYHIAKY